MLTLLKALLPARPSRGVLVLEPTANGKAEAPQRFPLTVPGEMQLDLPGVAWKARVEADGYWSESRPLAGGKGPGTQVWLIPLGRIRGSLELPPGTKALPDVGVRVRSTPRQGTPGLVDSVVTCPVVDGELECAVPSGLLDLRIRREPLAPVYAWGVQVPAGGAVDLGTIQLRQGASVSGWLETADGKPVPSECRVVATRLPSRSASRSSKSGEPSSEARSPWPRRSGWSVMAGAFASTLMRKVDSKDSYPGPAAGTDHPDGNQGRAQERVGPGGAGRRFRRLAGEIDPPQSEVDRRPGLVRRRGRPRSHGHGMAAVPGSGRQPPGPGRGRPDRLLPPSVPQETGSLNVLVFPPGHALRMLTATVAPGSPLEIPVDPSSGTLVLELGTGNGPMPLLVHNGVFASLQFLKPWMRMQGTRQDDPRKLVLGGMEPGVYSLCGGAPAVGALTEGKAPPAASCSTGVLAAHSELVLKNP